MQLFLLIVSIILLLIITYQDFKFNAILWYIFPLLFLVLLSSTISKTSFSASLSLFISNFVLVLIIYLFLVVYIFIRNRKFNFKLDGFLGFGDLLFMICLTPVFSQINFISFLVFGLLISMIFSLIYVLLLKKKLIPLAGLLAIYYIFIFIIDYFVAGFNVLNDQLILNYLPWM